MNEKFLFIWGQRWKMCRKEELKYHYRKTKQGWVRLLLKIMGKIVAEANKPINHLIIAKETSIIMPLT